MGTQEPTSLAHHLSRVLATLAMIIFAVLLWRIRNILLLAFGACLLALVLRSAASLIERWLGIGALWSLAFVIALVLAFLVVVGWLFGKELGAQMHLLAHRLPQAWALARAWLEQHPFGAMLLRALQTNLPGVTSVASGMKHAVAIASSAVLTVLLLGFGSVYLAANPSVYREGLLKLLPPNSRERAASVLASCSVALRQWLLSQLLVMLTVGTLTGVGLWLVGVPAPMALGLLTGLLEFVPFAGPIAAAIPGIVIAFAVGPLAALSALAVYVVVQQLESNLIYPLVARRMLVLPPALVLFSLVASGLTLGPLGWVLAMPITIVVAVVVGRLYVRQALGTSTSVPGDG